jgi:hypothetical protein
MPDERTVWRWRQDHPDFAEAFARARVDQMHAWADQIVHLADDAEGDFKVTVPLNSPELERIESNGEVTLKFTRKHVARTAQMIDVRKWLMARFAPEDFGDRSSVRVEANHVDKSDEELVREFQEAAHKAGVTADMIVAWLEPVECPA